MNFNEALRLMEECDKLYNNGSETKLSDREYDALVEEIEKRTGKEFNHSAVSLGKREKVFIDVPVLSLKKTYDISNIITWIKGIERKINTHFSLVLSPKFDGVRVRVVYEDKLLKHVLLKTRSNKGQISITDKLINRVPLLLPDNLEIKDMHLDAEVLISDKNLKQLKAISGKSFSSKLTAVTSVLSQKDHIEEQLNLLDVVFHSISSKHKKDLPTVLMLMNRKHEIKFVVIKSNSEHLEKDIMNFYKDQYKARDKGYKKDGIVISISNPELYLLAGKTKNYMLGAIALKFKSPSKISIIKEIIVKDVPKGKSYVAIIEPVVLSGREINKVNVHSPSYIKAKGLEIGSKVNVTLRGDLIPIII